VEDLDREVLTAFAEDLHLLLLQHLPRAVMRVDDVVTELELDELDLAGDLDVLCQGCFFSCLCRNGCPPSLRATDGPTRDSSL
jgi:hypothetical protein